MLGLGVQEGVLWLWAPRLFPGEAVKGPVPSSICQESEHSSRASLMWTFAGEELPEEEPFPVATDSTSESRIMPTRKEEVPSPKQVPLSSQPQRSPGWHQRDPQAHRLQEAQVQSQAESQVYLPPRPPMSVWPGP